MHRMMNGQQGGGLRRNYACEGCDYVGTFYSQRQWHGWLNLHRRYCKHTEDNYSDLRSIPWVQFNHNTRGGGWRAAGIHLANDPVLDIEEVIEAARAQVVEAEAAELPLTIQDLFNEVFGVDDALVVLVENVDGETTTIAIKPDEVRAIDIIKTVVGENVDIDDYRLIMNGSQFELNDLISTKAPENGQRLRIMGRIIGGAGSDDVMIDQSKIFVYLLFCL